MSGTQITRPTLTFVTGNANKLREVTDILHRTLPHITILSHSLDLPELQGDPHSVCLAKLQHAATTLPNTPILVDDTSLCFNALNGLPGVYIKWFLDKVGHTGLNNMLAGFTDKSAIAQCIFGLMRSPTSPPHLFTGQCQGQIVPARGDTAFGWDPVFEPTGYDVTYAQMDKEVKNKISHRSDALRQLAEYLTAHPEFFD